MLIITQSKCYKAGVSMYDRRVCGPEAVAAAVHELIDRKVESIVFSCGDHPQEGGRIVEILALAIRPYDDGSGREEVYHKAHVNGRCFTCSFCLQNSDGEFDPAELAARAVHQLTSCGKRWIFRLREEGVRDDT